MNFINLRNVAGQEINQSYCGILRITPYEQDSVKFDDPTPLLYDIGGEIKLSDSDGNPLNITFIPEIYPTVIINERDEEEEVNLIMVKQDVKNLFCSKSLHIRPTLHITPDKGKAPIQVINDNGVLLFPIDTPEDDRYINYNRVLSDQYGIEMPEGATDEQIQKMFDDIPANAEIYQENGPYSDYHVKINGKQIYRFKPKSSVVEDDVDAMVPELYRHDYVLGQCGGHTYKVSTPVESPKFTPTDGPADDAINYITELSFVEVEKIIWSLLGGSVNGAYRSFDGRYKNLYPTGPTLADVGTENNLWKALFVGNKTDRDDIYLEDKIRSNAPLVGLPVQPGLITYNAIPFRRFMFHALRRDPNVYTADYAKRYALNDDTGLMDLVNVDETFIKTSAAMPALFMHNLTTEYVLCDGRRIKYNGTETDYPSINRRSTAWSNWSGDSTVVTCVYDALQKSMTPSEEGVVRTPRLFELNQYAGRFLRGLNWERTVSFEQKETGEDETTVTKEWPYNPDTMVVETDGSYIINDWYLPDAAIKPDVNKDTFNYKFKNNVSRIQLPNTEVDDPANVAKDIHQVGVHYANYDYKLTPANRHVHQTAIGYDLLENYDSLHAVRGYYSGTSESRVPGHSTWEGYVKLETEQFLGTYAMRSVQGLGITDKNLIREIQDLPIAYRGGTTSALRHVRAAKKTARVKLGRCTGNREKYQSRYYADGGYMLAAWRPRSDGHKEGWRLLSSLPVFNKYGSWKDAEDYATATFHGKIILIDDSLPTPPSINLLPLMKI